MRPAVVWRSGCCRRWPSGGEKECPRPHAEVPGPCRYHRTSSGVMRHSRPRDRGRLRRPLRSCGDDGARTVDGDRGAGCPRCVEEERPPPTQHRRAAARRLGRCTRRRVSRLFSRRHDVPGRLPPPWSPRIRGGRRRGAATARGAKASTESLCSPASARRGPERLCVARERVGGRQVREGPRVRRRDRARERTVGQESEDDVERGVTEGPAVDAGETERGDARVLRSSWVGIGSEASRRSLPAPASAARRRYLFEDAPPGRQWRFTAGPGPS